jgi:hypothetical protein
LFISSLISCCRLSETPTRLISFIALSS